MIDKRYSFTELAENDIIKINNITYENIHKDWIEKIAKTANHELHEKCYDLFVSHLTGNRIIDIGCGPGLDSIRFLKHGLDVVSVDIQIGFLKNLKEKQKRIKTVVMDMRFPAFRKESFNGIFSIAAFLHIPNTYSLDILSKIHSLLHKDGILLLHHVSSDNSEDGYIVENVLGSNNNLYCFCSSKKRMKAMLIQAGFSDVQFYDLQNSNKTDTMKEKKLSSYQVLAKK